MSRAQTIDRIRTKLDTLSDEQLESIFDMADAYSRKMPAEDEAALAAIAEGVLQAKRGERVPQAEIDTLLKRPWR